MKKILLSALVLSAGFFAEAQQVNTVNSPANGGLYVATNLRTADSTRTFSVFNVEKDAYKDAMLRWLGKPVENTNGTIIWKGVKVEGLGNDIQITISDGLLTHDTAARSACYTPFKSNEDKQRKMAHLLSNQERRMEVTFNTQNNINPVNNLTLENACIAFLRNAYQ